MIYAFERPDGAVVEEWSPMAEAVPIGEMKLIDGVACRRLASLPEPSVEREVRFTTYQYPEGWPYAKHWETKPDGTRGFPQFHSRSELRECLARANHNGEGVGWDGRL